MKITKLMPILVGLMALAGATIADIPGLFVVQEARIDDPTPGAITARSYFGRGGFSSIGDFDGDGVDDLIAGAFSASNDTGAIYLMKLNRNGSLKGSPFTISATSEPFKSHLKPGGKDQFGRGVVVVRKFSKTQPCAIVMTSSAASKKIWAFDLCNEQNTPVVRNLTIADTLSPGLSSYVMASVGIGSSMAVLDTLNTGAVVVALGIPSDGPTATSRTGRVVIASIDTGTLALHRLALYPETYDNSDLFWPNLTSGERFGSGVASLRGIGGHKGMAVISSTFSDLSGNVSGRVHLVTFDNNYKFLNDIPLAGSPNFPVNQAPSAIATADFNNDGISDLLVGYNADQQDVAGRGAFSLSLLNADGSTKSSSFFRKGEMGLQDTANGTGVMLANTGFGIQLSTSDFDHDGQMDVLVGSLGNPAGSSSQIIGSIWPLRFKQLPRTLKPIDTITLSKTEAILQLRDFVVGNRLGWSLSQLQDPPTTLAKCSLSVATDTTFLHCIPGGTNGNSRWRLIASDSGNIPSTLHYFDTLDFTVKVVGQDSAPVQTASLPKIRISEDQHDTSVLAFSQFFRDPEKKPLIFSVTSLNNSTAAPLSYLALSANSDTLHLAGSPYHPALCSLRVDVKDNANGLMSDTLVIEVFHVNHAPKMFDTSYIVTESVPTLLSVRSLDYDQGDVLVGGIQTAPKHGVAVMQGSQVLYTPDSFYLGSDSLVYKVTDGQLTSLSMVRLTVIKTTATARVYKPLADITIDEDTPPFEIRVDSLFFSGAERFTVMQDEAITNCDTLKVATIKNDRINFRLKISPLPYHAGRCQITIPTVKDPKVFSSMYLNVRPIVHPYKYQPDTLTEEVLMGSSATVLLDSVDLDRDTLVHSTITSPPSWVHLDGFRLMFNPDTNSKAGKILIVSRKKPLAGVTFLDVTDTLIVYAIPTTSLQVGRRIGDRVRMSNHFGKLEFQGGSSPFQIAIFSVDGHVLISRTVPEMGRVEIDRNHLPTVVYLRLTEKNKSSVIPLFLNSSN